MKFVRTDGQTFKQLGTKWRRPKGIHNKMRWCKRGKGASPAIGYSRSEKKIIPVIANMNDVQKIKGDAVLSSTIGNKKRIEILEKISKTDINLLNVKDVQKEIQKLKESFEKRKKSNIKKPVVEKKEVKKVPSKEEQNEGGFVKGAKPLHEDSSGFVKNDGGFVKDDKSLHEDSSGFVKGAKPLHEESKEEKAKKEKEFKKQVLEGKK